MGSRRAALTVLACAAGAATFAVFLGSQAFAVAPSAGASPPASSSALAGSSVSATPLGLSAASPASSWAGRGGMAAAALIVMAASALIVQNKGGGHGEIGYHLAMNLAKEKGMKVVMINDSAAKKDKPPFDAYGDLEAAGVEVKYADLAEGGLASAMEGVGPCEYVFDNQNVCPKDVQKAVAGWSPKAYAYVSSGGMYKPIPEGPLLETGDVKEDNKQLGIEKAATDAGLPLSAFRPQYIYGPKTNKRDYLDWFFDRIVNDLEFPLPGDGSLRTTLTNAEDVAGMLASVVGNEEAAAKQKVFNCATDVRISHNEVVEAVAKAAGKDPAEVLKKVVYYDPKAMKGVELPKGGKFPFRETHFGVGVDTAKSVLKWSPKHTLEGDLAAYFEEYKKLGKDTKPVVREWDEAVIKAATASA